MAKRKADLDWEQKHKANISIYQSQIAKIYDSAIREAARIGSSLEIIGDEAFSFDNYPHLREQVKNLFSGLSSQLYVTIVNGIQAEWTLANNKNSELAKRVFGDKIGKLTQEQYRRYFKNNGEARDAFIARKEGGLNLSDRVWKYSNMYKREIETALDIGIRNGQSAADMTRELRDYLKYPDKLFRRVRDEEGNLHLSKAAKEFHPGQGVYRSSYMNARRLAATETNIAYRTADYLRMQEFDFVVGIRVNLSDHHACKGVPGVFTDICDDLKGDYPKDFKFVGWHPHCRCYTTTILKTQEEMDADDERLFAGEEPLEGSENEVERLPENFKAWVRDNEERIGNAKSLPYFIKDNQELISAEILREKEAVILDSSISGSSTPLRIRQR